MTAFQESFANICVQRRMKSRSLGQTGFVYLSQFKAMQVSDRDLNSAKIVDKATGESVV